MSRPKRNPFNGGISWLVSIHGTEVKILSAFFPKEYLAAVNTPFMRPNKRVVVFESKAFNLKPETGRREAVTAVIVKWLKSEEAWGASTISYGTSSTTKAARLTGSSTMPPRARQGELLGIAPHRGQQICSENTWNA